MIPRRWGALLLALLFGCSGPQRFIHLETGEGKALIHLPRPHGAQPVKVGREEFQHSLQRLALEVRLLGSPRATVWRMFQLDALSGDFLYLPRDKKLVPVGPGFPLEGALTQEEEKLTRDYQAWCRHAYGAEGDCLGGALVGGRYMDLQGRYTLALALSRSPVLDEMQAALGAMVSFQAVFSAALWTVGTLLFLLALPEPVTKALAAAMTTVLVLWVGIDTLFNLIAGWLRLTEEVKEAHTFVRGGTRGGRALRQGHRAGRGAGVRHAGDGGHRADCAGVRGEGADVAWLGPGGDAGGGSGGHLVAGGGRGAGGGGHRRRLVRGITAGRGGDGGAGRAWKCP